MHLEVGDDVALYYLVASVGYEAVRDHAASYQSYADSHDDLVYKDLGETLFL